MEYTIGILQKYSYLALQLYDAIKNSILQNTIMSMKTIKYIGIIACCALLPSLVQAQNKETEKEKAALKVTKYTVMEKFEPNFVTSPKERIRLKRARIALVKKQRSIIDTLDVSERKRRRLLRDLYNNPFSDRLSRNVIVETEFSDEDQED